MYNFIQEIFGKAFGCSSTIIEGVSDLVIVPDMDLFAMPYIKVGNPKINRFYCFLFIIFTPFNLRGWKVAGAELTFILVIPF